MQIDADNRTSWWCRRIGPGRANDGGKQVHDFVSIKSEVHGAPVAAPAAVKHVYTRSFIGTGCRVANQCRGGS